MPDNVNSLPSTDIRQTAIYSIVSPMLRAVPSMVLMALSRLVVFQSGIFMLAISSILAREIVPTFSRFGRPEPFGTPDAFLRRSAARGGFGSGGGGGGRRART